MHSPSASHPLANGLFEMPSTFDSEYESPEYHRLLNAVSMMIANQVKAEVSMVTLSSAEISPALIEQLKTDIKVELEVGFRKEYEIIRHDIDTLTRFVEADSFRTAGSTNGIATARDLLQDQRVADILQSMESQQRITGGLLADVAKLEDQVSSTQQIVDSCLQVLVLESSARNLVGCLALDKDKSAMRNAISKKSEPEPGAFRPLVVPDDQSPLSSHLCAMSLHPKGCLTSGPPQRPPRAVFRGGSSSLPSRSSAASYPTMKPSSSSPTGSSVSGLAPGTSTPAASWKSLR